MARFEHQGQSHKWVDCEAPTQEELLKLAEEFPIPLQALTTCLDPEHLPKCEAFHDVIFFIIRHYDAESSPTAATMQELTTKLVFFVGKDFVLTIHRGSIPCITEKKQKSAFENISLTKLVQSLCLSTLKTFDQPLNELDNKVEIIEKRIFSMGRRNILREGYVTKRKISSYRKIFKFTADIFNKIKILTEISPREFMSIEDKIHKHIFFTENMHEDITGLLNLHVSILSQKTNEASFKTNEVMRVLTVFSIFFLPLNFIAGIYGMNFENMPELKMRYGYFAILGTMSIVVIFITLWIYKKGWLKKDEL